MKQLHGVSGIAGVVGSPRAARDLLAGRRITVTLWIVLLATASAAFPQAVTVTLEQPKVRIRLSKHTADHVAGFGGFCPGVLIR